jgi:hypothetical protein
MEGGIIIDNPNTHTALYIKKIMEGGIIIDNPNTHTALSIKNGGGFQIALYDVAFI